MPTNTPVVNWILPLVSSAAVGGPVNSMYPAYSANIISADAYSTTFELHCEDCPSTDKITSTLTVGPWAQFNPWATSTPGEGTGELDIRWTRMWETNLLTLTGAPLSGASLTQPTSLQTNTAALRPNIISIHCAVTSTSLVGTCVLQSTTSVGPIPSTYPPITLTDASIALPFTNIYIFITSGYQYLDVLTTTTPTTTSWTSLSWPTSDQVPTPTPTALAANTATTTSKAGGSYSLLTAATSTATTTAKSAGNASRYSAASRTSVMGLLGMVAASLLLW